MKHATTTHLRIIISIALKDIRDAIQNKLILGILIGVALTMLSSQALPLLLKAKAQPRAFFLDPGHTTTTKELARNPSLDLVSVASMADLQNAVGTSSVPVLGLVFPDDLETRLASNSLLEIKAYRIYWASGEDLARLVTYFEEVLSQHIGLVVRLQVMPELIYPPAKGLGFTSMIATGFVLGIMTIGLILAPLLLVEEIENHTFEAILISPASTTHLLLGKALAGLFYALVAGVVMFAFSWRWIAHWEIALPAVLLGATSSIAVGLLIGALCTQSSSVNLWSGMAIVFFLVPVFIWTSIASKLSPVLQLILQAIPSIALTDLLHLSFSHQPPFQQVIMLLAGMVLFTVLVLGLVGIRLSRMRR